MENPQTQAASTPEKASHSILKSSIISKLFRKNNQENNPPLQTPADPDTQTPSMLADQANPIPNPGQSTTPDLAINSNLTANPDLIANPNSTTSSNLTANPDLTENPNSTTNPDLATNSNLTANPSPNLELELKFESEQPEAKEADSSETKRSPAIEVCAPDFQQETSQEALCAETNRKDEVSLHDVERKESQTSDSLIDQEENLPEPAQLESSPAMSEQPAIASEVPAEAHTKPLQASTYSQEPSECLQTKNEPESPQTELLLTNPKDLQEPETPSVTSKEVQDILIALRAVQASENQNTDSPKEEISNKDQTSEFEIVRAVLRKLEEMKNEEEKGEAKKKQESVKKQESEKQQETDQAQTAKTQAAEEEMAEPQSKEATEQNLLKKPENGSQSQITQESSDSDSIQDSRVFVLHAKEDNLELGSQTKEESQESSLHSKEAAPESIPAIQIQSQTAERIPQVLDKQESDKIDTLQKEIQEHIQKSKEEGSPTPSQNTKPASNISWLIDLANQESPSAKQEPQPLQTSQPEPETKINPETTPQQHPEPDIDSEPNTNSGSGINIEPGINSEPDALSVSSIRPVQELQPISKQTALETNPQTMDSQHQPVQTKQTEEKSMEQADQLPAKIAESEQPAQMLQANHVQTQPAQEPSQTIKPEQPQAQPVQETAEGPAQTAAPVQSAPDTAQPADSPQTEQPQTQTVQEPEQGSTQTAIPVQSAPDTAQPADLPQTEQPQAQRVQETTQELPQTDQPQTEQPQVQPAQSSPIQEAPSTQSTGVVQPAEFESVIKNNESQTDLEPQINLEPKVEKTIVEPTQAVEPSYSVEAAQNVEPSKAEELAQPAAAAQPAEPPKAIQTDEPTQQTESAESLKTDQPVELEKPVTDSEKPAKKEGSRVQAAKKVASSAIEKARKVSQAVKAQFTEPEDPALESAVDEAVHHARADGSPNGSGASGTSAASTANHAAQQGNSYQQGNPYQNPYQSYNGQNQGYAGQNQVYSSQTGQSGPNGYAQNPYSNGSAYTQNHYTAGSMQAGQTTQMGTSVTEMTPEFGGSLGLLMKPEVLNEYNVVLPGAAHRIFEMAELEQQARLKANKIVLKANIANERRGQWMSFLIVMAGLLTGTVLIVCNKAAAGLAAFICSIILLVLLFLYGKVGALLAPFKMNLSQFKFWKKE